MGMKKRACLVFFSLLFIGIFSTTTEEDLSRSLFSTVGFKEETINAMDFYALKEISFHDKHYSTHLSRVLEAAKSLQVSVNEETLTTLGGHGARTTSTRARRGFFSFRDSMTDDQAAPFQRYAPGEFDIFSPFCYSGYNPTPGADSDLGAPGYYALMISTRALIIACDVTTFVCSTSITCPIPVSSITCTIKGVACIAAEVAGIILENAQFCNGNAHGDLQGALGDQNEKLYAMEAAARREELQLQLESESLPPVFRRPASEGGRLEDLYTLVDKLYPTLADECQDCLTPKAKLNSAAKIESGKSLFRAQKWSEAAKAFYQAYHMMVRGPEF